MEREFNYDISDVIKTRWSPRAFSKEKVPKKDIYAILEAAHFAPSCYNDQPWRFIVARDSAGLKKMYKILTEKNLLWANHAPVLILLLSLTKFRHNQFLNRWNQFDAGCAWGFMALEAARRGFVTHAMGGFDEKKAREQYDIGEEYNINSVIAIGKLGNKKNLPSEFQEMEYPKGRLALEKLILNHKTSTFF